MCEYNGTFGQRLLSKLYETGEYSDVTFIIDGEAFRVHKYILAASCPYFASMLFGNMEEATLKTICLKDTSPITFKYVLDFIYTGRVTESKLSEVDLIALIVLSHEYQFKDLITFLLLSINVSEFSISNVLELAKLANIYEFNDLSEKCLEILDESARELVSDSALFGSIPIVLLKELIVRDTFVVFEIDLFKALLEWKNVNPAENCSDIFACIRLCLISAKDFNEIVRPTNLLSPEKYLNAIANLSEKERVRRCLPSVPPLLEKCKVHHREMCVYANQCFVNYVPSFRIKFDYKAAASKSFVEPKSNSLTLFPGDVVAFTLNTQCDVNYVSFNILSNDFKSNQDYELRTTNGTMEKIIVPMKSGYFRYGTQNIYFEPQQVNVFKLTANDKLDIDLTSISCQRIVPKISFPREPELLPDHAASKVPLPISTNGGKRFVFAYSCPNVVSRVKIADIGYYNPPLDVFVKNKITDEWLKVGTITELSQKEFEIGKIYIAFIAITGKELYSIKITCE